MEVIEHSLDDFEHVVLETTGSDAAPEPTDPEARRAYWRERLRAADPEAYRAYRRELIRAADRVAPLVEWYARRLRR